MDRLNSMQAFVTTADTGSFSAAGRQLGLSATMVTKHVQSLEDRLGVRLLHRSTRRLALTEAGSAYRDRCQQLLIEIEEAEATVSADRLQPRGTLRVNAPAAFAVLQIAPHLVHYSRDYPEVTVELGLSNRAVDLLEEGWDIAVRIGQLNDSALLARRLGPSRMVVCAAPEYLSAHGVPRTVAELAGHNCLTYTPAANGISNPWLFQGPYGEIAVPVTGNLQASDAGALHAAALAGQGILLEPTFLVGSDLASGRLLPVTLDHAPLEMPIHALWSPGRRLSPKVRSFVDFLTARTGPEPPWDTWRTSATGVGYAPPGFMAN